MSILPAVHAGYLIRGINASNVDYDNLMNYTLTFDGAGNPIAAATMQSMYANVKNNIVIIRANSPWSDVFQFEKDHDIEVRDFLKTGTDMYVICGSIQYGTNFNAFVAVVYNNFSRMLFYEYPEADCFYSIWHDDSNILPAFNSYMVCGTRGNKGVIASISRVSMQITDFFITENNWQYHKIISKVISVGSLQLFASGRNPDCDTIGFSTFYPSFNTITSYKWEQRSKLASHCVVSDYIGVSNKIVISSSFDDEVTINSITFSPAPTLISAFHFSFPDASYYVQDIGTFLQEDGDVRISVAGFKNEYPTQHRAWHGYVVGLSAGSIMTNNYYFAANSDLYEHYKIRYYNGEEYTGGYFQGVIQGTYSECALFSTPLKLSDDCDYFEFSKANEELVPYSSFELQSFDTKPITAYFHESDQYLLFVYDYCGELKGGLSPEFSMQSPESESEIIICYDRITVKDTPAGTKYQIYSITGQLIQTGNTNSDISTTQLTKGMYILRLEDGKAFKFIK
jgi:hypothetical protein